MIRIAINGLGRIGRSIFRLLTTTDIGSDFELVTVNDIADGEMCAYLLEHDTIFGQYPGGVSFEGGHILAGAHKIPITCMSDPADLDLSGVDLFLDCTGKANTQKFAEGGLLAGAKRVLISGPSDNAEATIVIGANELLIADQKIISNASCTTNALAPVLKLIDQEFGLVSANMTTIHCYTGSQPTIDAPRGDFARSRAAALSMVPTTTSAGKLTEVVLPHLADKIFATSVRVPTASVSAIDISFQVENDINVTALNDLFKAANGSVIGVTEKVLVSSDLRARPESAIIALPQTNVTNNRLARVFGWYDNEWGFSNRMLDLARLMARREA